MRLRAVVPIALLAMLTGIVGCTAVAAHANASNVDVVNNVAFELQAPHVAGSSDAAPISTSSLRSTSLLAALAYVTLLLLLAIWFATDASLRMPAFALLRSTQRRRAPPLPLV